MPVAPMSEAPSEPSPARSSSGRRIRRAGSGRGLPVFGPLVLAGLLGLAGCSTVPEYQAPVLPLAVSWAQAAGTADAVGGQWWEEFHTAELNALIGRGLDGNYSLSAAASRIDQARAAAGVAAAGEYPTLALGTTVQRQDRKSGSAKSNIALQASYEADFWGKQRARAGSADAALEASVFDAQTLRMSLGADIANAYFEVLSRQDQIRLANSIADDAQQVLALIEVRAAQGAASELDVAQQRNALQTFLAAVPPLRQQRDLALYQLAVLTGQAPEGFQLTETGLGEVAIPHPTAGLPLGLLRQRPDIGAAEARLRAANFDIGVARAAFLPSLTLNLSTGVSLLGGNVWAAVASAALPLFNAGALQGQLDVNRARFDELTANYRQSVLVALRDVDTQLSASRELDAAYALNQAAVTSSREAARLAQVRYRLGATDFQTLLVVERTQYQAESTMLLTRLQQLQASVGLFRALGGDFTPTTSSSLASPS